MKMFLFNFTIFLNHKDLIKNDNFYFLLKNINKFESNLIKWIYFRYNICLRSVLWPGVHPAKLFYSLHGNFPC
jgi:hypothetical protein